MKGGETKKPIGQRLSEVRRFLRVGCGVEWVGVFGSATHGLIPGASGVRVAVLGKA